MDFMSILMNPIVEAAILGLMAYVSYRNRQHIARFVHEDPKPQVIDFVALMREQAAQEQKKGPSTNPTDSVVPATPVAAVRGEARATYQPLDLNPVAPQVQSIKLSTVAQEQNVLVTGPKGSGKTTILRTILGQRLDSECIAIDPHNEPGKWLCRVVGGGLAWQDIANALRAMETGMTSRFTDLNNGVCRSGEFPQRTFVADEFLAIVQKLNGKANPVDAGELLISRLTQGRKVGECILLAAQNDTVQALGISGNSDLKACFDYLIFLGGNIETRARRQHGCPEDIAQEAFRQKRPAVVWHSERNNWYVLVFDLEPVREGQVLNVSPVVPNGSTELVPVKTPEITGSEHGNQYGTGTEPVPGTDGIDDETIKALHSAGWSRNKIAERMKGRREERLARIRRVLGDDQTTGAAITA